MPRYTVLIEHLRHNGRQLVAGDEVDMTEAQARPKLDRGDLTLSTVQLEDTPDGGPPDPPEPTPEPAPEPETKAEPKAKVVKTKATAKKE